MPRVHKQVEMGLRWLTCGARLFRRNPWQLGAMGLLGALLVAALAAIPLIGIPLAGFVLPGLVAALYLALDTTVQAPRPLARLAAIKAAPRALVGVLADEGRLIQIVVLSLGSMSVALVAVMLAGQVAGSAWWIRSELDSLTYARAAAAAMIAIVVCSVAAGGLVYALPLALLRRQALLDALGRSFRAAGRHLWALAVLEGVVLLPLVFGVAARSISPALAHTVAIAVGAIVLPLVVAGLYCSYRTLFPAPAARPVPAPARARTARRA